MVLHSLINLFSFQFRHIIRSALLKMELGCDLFITLFRVLQCSFFFFILLPQCSENLGARINKDRPMVLQKKFQSQQFLPRLNTKSENSIVFSP